MAHTFADLGIPFLLFEAPLTNASGYLGLARCCFCTREAVHCFAIKGTDEVVVSCRHCGEQMGLDASQGSKECCWSCEQEIPFPGSLEHIKKLTVCYDCLRAGAVALPKDTPYGLVDWKHAREGHTSGAPVTYPVGNIELIPLEEEEEEEEEAALILGTGFVMTPSDNRWFAARIAPVHLFELLHTPNYSTWQGKQWALCCHQPMIFLGDWQQEDFERHAPDGNGQALFFDLLDVDPLYWNALASGTISVFVFRCSVCEKLAAHWDGS